MSADETPPHLPVRAKLDASGLHVALAAILPAQMSDPFLHETVRRVAAQQTIVHVRSADLGSPPPPAAPSGLLFHVSRCGSTLVSQSLKQLDQVAVYSEPTALNELLMPPHPAGRSQMLAALRTLVAMFGAHARSPYVLKLSSWNALWCDMFTEAFPDTPWALCVRDPVEVCASLLDTRPGWLRDDQIFRFAPLIGPEYRTATPETRSALTFARLCEAAGRLDPAKGMLLQYQNLPEDVWGRLAAHFGLEVSPARRQRMIDAAKRDAKAPLESGRLFLPDGERKRSSASPSLREAIDLIATTPYLDLLEKWSGIGSRPAANQSSCRIG
jgi:hypothetical protein